ncbi:hypothetical protein LIER_41058 [Lithospermum erythrorhizon]|uniref:Uncharacterized protein n=1 Tax=Lithospermum erythrorhizon TaxID=34254 RepID=A0AAV3R3M4_LITER
MREGGSFLVLDLQCRTPGDVSDIGYGYLEEGTQTGQRQVPPGHDRSQTRPVYLEQGQKNQEGIYVRQQSHREWPPPLEKKKTRNGFAHIVAKKVISDHITLNYVLTYEGADVTFGDGCKGQIIGKERLNVKGFPELRDVLLVKELTTNLISVSELYDNGWTSSLTRMGIKCQMKTRSLYSEGRDLMKTAIKKEDLRSLHDKLMREVKNTEFWENLRLFQSDSGGDSTAYLFLAAGKVISHEKSVKGILLYVPLFSIRNETHGLHEGRCMVDSDLCHKLNKSEARVSFTKDACTVWNSTEIWNHQLSELSETCDLDYIWKKKPGRKPMCVEDQIVVYNGGCVNWEVLQKNWKEEDIQAFVNRKRVIIPWLMSKEKYTEQEYLND